MGIQTVEESGCEKSLIVKFFFIGKSPMVNDHIGYYLLNRLKRIRNT